MRSPSNRPDRHDLGPHIPLSDDGLSDGRMLEEGSLPRLKDLPPEATLIVDSQDVEAVMRSLGIAPGNRDEFNAFMATSLEGDLWSVWGFSGIPFSHRRVFPLLVEGLDSDTLKNLKR